MKKQQRINELAWKIVDYFFPQENKGKELVAYYEDLEKGLNAVIDKLNEMKNKYKCPICNGSGRIENPTLLKREWNEITKRAAKVLLDNGYSIRQVKKLLGFGSTRTILIIKNERKKLLNE